MKSRRMSGEDMDDAAGLPFIKKSSGKFNIDLGAIDKAIEAYIDKDDDTKKYSISGFCIALGITRSTLELWRLGYVSKEDASDARVRENSMLAEIVAKAELYVHRYWEECEESKLQTKHTKLLESAGVLEKTGRNSSGPPFELGSLSKYAR